MRLRRTKNSQKLSFIFVPHPRKKKCGVASTLATPHFFFLGWGGMHMALLR